MILILTWAVYLLIYLHNTFTTCRIWRSINFKLNKAGLNSEFSLSWMGCFIKVKGFISSQLFFIPGEEQMYSPFSKRHLCKVKHKLSRPIIELRLMILFDTLINVTLTWLLGNVFVSRNSDFLRKISTSLVSLWHGNTDDSVSILDDDQWYSSEQFS